MRYLGIDHGTRRVGLAIGDSEGGVAVPLRVLHCTNDSEAVAQIAVVIVREGIERIVVGMPLPLRSTPATASRQVAAVESFIALLRVQSPVPVETIDERFSTREANDRMHDAGSDASERDAIAASILLQTYLDARDQENKRSQDQTTTVFS